MPTNAKHLAVRPEADTETVEDLVGRVTRGMVRIPSFQRGLKWGAEDVLALFDSIYRGYPIGSLLFRKGAADAKPIEVGPLRIDAPETQSAWWVIDGQQRLTALSAGLARPTPIPTTPIDPFAVYFDATSQKFEAPPKNGEIPTTWVPVAHLLDASDLSEWIFTWPHSGNATLRGSVFQAGTLLRQYRVPFYVAETDDEAVLREIFFRMNNLGKSLEWGEVHDAVYGDSAESPTTLGDLATELQQVGMGRPDEELLLTCLVAYKGLDATRSFSEHYRRDSGVLRDTVRDAMPSIRRVLSFLRREAEIPHLRLLPRSLPFVVLTRFFHLFPEPNARTMQLLARWAWRTLLTTAFFDERTLLRRGVSGIREEDAEGSARELLALVPQARPTDFFLPARFDARAAESRFALLGMASLGPINPSTEHPLDIAALVEERDAAAFRSIIPQHKGLARSPANRILLPGPGSARQELLKLIERGSEKVLASHGISPQAAAALSAGKVDEFLQDRKAVLEEAVRDLADRLAAWGRTDRASLQYILREAEEEI